MKKNVAVGCMSVASLVVISAMLVYGQAANSAGPVGSGGATKAAPPTSKVVHPQPETRSAAEERALLDRYCVTCHNDKTKTANFSLQNLDLATVGDHAELWEKVVRKLRAGLMPPPGVRRPPLAEYDGLRDWLEAEIDRNAAGRTNPGSVILHRLNR